VHKGLALGHCTGNARLGKTLTNFNYLYNQTAKFIRTLGGQGGLAFTADVRL